MTYKHNIEKRKEMGIIKTEQYNNGLKPNRGMLGKIPHNKGKTKENYESLQKTSDALKLKYKLGTTKSGFKKGNQINKGKTPWNKDVKYSEDFKEEHNFGCPKGHTNTWSKNLTKETDKRLKNISENMKGEKNPCYKDGSSNKPYSLEFDKELKEKIKKRDGHRCQECFRHQTELKSPLHVHHIDYNKMNCDENNLITLCRSCHGKTSFNVKNWITYYQNKIKVET